MNLDSFAGPGSTPSRRRFWDKITQAVNASQKIAGKNVAVDVYQGYGSLINVVPQRQGSGPTPTGACCFSDVCEVRTEAECIGAEGVYQGDGIPCDPSPCCTTCTPLVVGPPCTDLDGNFWTIQNCDGSCSGEMFTDPSTSFMTHTAWCATGGDGCSIQSTNCITVRNPMTCEDVMTGPCDGICPDGQGIIDGVSVLYVPCPPLSPPP